MTYVNKVIMWHVKFKKRPYHSVDFKGQSHVQGSPHWQVSTTEIRTLIIIDLLGDSNIIHKVYI